MKKLTPAEQVKKFAEAFQRAQRRMIESDHQTYGIPLRELEAMMLGGLDSYALALKHYLAQASK